MTAAVKKRNPLEWILVSLLIFPSSVFAQAQQCYEGIVRLAAGNGNIEICRAVAEQDPVTAAKLTEALQSLSEQQVQINRLLKNVDSLGQQVELKRQGELLRSLLARLDAKDRSNAPERQRSVADLTYALDDLREEIDHAKNNPRTSAEADNRLKGSLGDAIAGLDLEKAHTLLADIEKQLGQINSKLDTVQSNTTEILSSVQQERVSPDHIRAALEAADLKTLDLVQKAGTSPLVIEAELRQRSADGKSGVARRFFEASRHSSEASQWLEGQLRHGLDPNLFVAADYYPTEGLLWQALKAHNVEASLLLLQYGASAHAFQELSLTPYAQTRFLFPLAAVTGDQSFTLEEKRTLVKAMLAAGATVLDASPPGTREPGTQMTRAKQSQQELSAQLAMSPPVSPSLCERAENPICKAASKRTGEDWCKRIEAMPKSIRISGPSPDTPFFDITLQSLLLIEQDKAYFVGLSPNVDYVLVEISKDASNWTVVQFGRGGFGAGQCQQDDDKFRPEQCWHRFPLTRISGTNQMQYEPSHQTWTLTKNSCSTAAAAAIATPSDIPNSNVRSVPSSATAPGGLPGLAFRTTLLMLRDNPELLEDRATLAEMARWILYGEVGARNELRRLEEAPPEGPGINTAHPAFVYEWSEILKKDPDFAKGAALDVFLRPDFDWSFVQNTHGWNPQLPRAWVGMFLFPRAAEMPDRDVNVAAQEVAPILREQLLLAAHRQSPDLWFVVNIKGAHYDPDAQALKFESLDLSERIMPTGANPPAPGIASYAIYPLQRIGEPTKPWGLRQNFPELDRWRELTGLKAAVDRLDLDRKLSPPTSLPLSPRLAESLRITSGVGLTGRIFVTAEHVRPYVDPTTKAAKFALSARLVKLEIRTTSGDIVSTVSATALPIANTVPMPESTGMPAQNNSPPVAADPGRSRDRISEEEKSALHAREHAARVEEMREENLKRGACRRQARAATETASDRREAFDKCMQQPSDEEQTK